MAVGDQQRIVTEIVSELLGEPAVKPDFLWFVNTVRKELFGENYAHIMKVFHALNGDNAALENKKPRKLSPDAYFGGKWNFFFEFDELQHFTAFKLMALSVYPKELIYGFPVNEYMAHCEKHHSKALAKGPAGYRKPKDEFPFENGRAAQRAFFDAFRDLQPQMHGLNPTIRISEFDIKNGISLKSKLREVLKKRLELINLEL